MKQKYFFIDFDSTFVQAEGLEVLAEVVLAHKKNRDAILNKIIQITNDGMEGKIDFGESLKKRIALIPATKKDIEKTVSVLQKKISPTIKSNKQFFKKYKGNIYIISGGFKEFVVPVVKSFGIAEDHVYANTFIINKKGEVVGIDHANDLSQKNGKVKTVQKLNPDGEIYVIGDGYTDYQIKDNLPHAQFIAYTETVFRESVTKKADYVVPSFDEFLYIYDFPRVTSYPKNRISVLLLENINQKAIMAFEKEGYAVEYFEKSLPEKELIKKIEHVSLLGIRSRTQVNQQVLQNAKRLLAVGAFCIGTDQIDLAESAQRGVAVFNAPYSNTRSVVELVLGEIIVLARRVVEKNVNMQQGVWDKSAVGAFEVRGKTLGIIGYGNIGSQLSVLAESLGMNVLYYDIVEKLAIGSAKRALTLRELLKNSDVITVHVDGRKDNTHLIGEKEFAQMKDKVLFLNLSRGSIVDINALTANLKKGKIGGAAVDVFPKEPAGRDEPFVSELQGISNVIITPHIGGSTKEAQENIGEFVANKLIEYMNTGNTYLNVSLPQVQLPALSHAHRMLHIHKNIPGVLANINRVFAENKGNIVGQYLKTDNEIGYVITDVNKKYEKAVLEELQSIEGTIKFRVLY